jgi:hypothetical protein
MITHRYANKTYMQGQLVQFKTLLFDKWYYWMVDGDGTTYLTPENDEGQPSFL